MGDWVSMEIKRKPKTLTGLFLKFAVLFCVNTFLIVMSCTLLVIGAAYAGLVLPANYAETQLTKHTEEIQKAGNDPKKLIPKTCTYGIYDGSGEWVTGNFTAEEREDAWRQYQNESIYAGRQSYYRFIRQDNGNICIVQYDLYMRYSWDKLNKILPAPEPMSMILAGILFVVDAFLLSRHFAKKLNRQLEGLRTITDKIAENDLEFQTEPSDIREVDAVMRSLSHMKDALRKSLSAQWDMEQQKQEQLASLAHDVKTPLTVIKGNAELLAESELSAEDRECTEYILSNVSDIQQYLDRMKEVLYGIPSAQEEKIFSCAQLIKMFQEAAVQVGTAEKMPVSFYEEGAESEDIGQGEPTDGICCCSESILRAWKNILSNAAEYTDKSKGIALSFSLQDKIDGKYLEAAVRDYGPGFSAKDLEHADQEFYSGDASRHDRRHQGLGMAIARKFLEEQGGRLEFGNRRDGGAEVRCLVKAGISH